jgi:hypothetical protein
VRLPVVVDVHHAVAAVGFHHGGDQHDAVPADVLNERALFHRQPVDQLRQHLRGAGFRGVDRAARPVERFSFGYQLFRLVRRHASGIGEPGGDPAVPVELRDVVRVADGDHEHLTTLFALADVEHPDAGALRLDQAHVPVDVGDAAEDAGGADDAVQRLPGGRHAGADGKVIDQLRYEVGIGCVFGNLPVVIGVRPGRAGIGLGTLPGLGGCGGKRERNRQQ